MKTLPPCDHDECPPTGCRQNADAKGVGISDGLAAAREQANAAWEHLTSVCAEAQKQRDAIDETVRQANIKWAEAYRNVKTQEAANAESSDLRDKPKM